MASQVKHGSVDALYLSAYPAFALLAALELDVFSALGAGPASAAEVASRLGVAPRRLAPLLDALAAAGLLERQGGRYANGPEADRTLVRGRPGYLEGLGALYLDRYKAALAAAQSIREDRPAARKDFAAMKPAEAAAFFGGMFERAVNAGVELARHVDFSGCRSILDAGGGSGGLAVGLCRALPHVSAAVADLAPVLPLARERVALAGMGERVSVIEADLLAGPLPGRYDAVVVRSVLQVMSEADAGRALRNAAAPVVPGGIVCAIGRMLDDSMLSPESSVFFNLVFISLYPEGRAYPERDYRAWMKAAGAEDVRRIALPGGHSIVWGRKR